MFLSLEEARSRDYSTQSRPAFYFSVLIFADWSLPLFLFMGKHGILRRLLAVGSGFVLFGCLFCCLPLLASGTPLDLLCCHVCCAPLDGFMA